MSILNNIMTVTGYIVWICFIYGFIKGLIILHKAKKQHKEILKQANDRVKEAMQRINKQLEAQNKLKELYNINCNELTKE